jgi:hypothetical protein
VTVLKPDRLPFFALALCMTSVSAGAANQVVVEHGVRYQLQSCRRNARSVVCVFNLSSLRPDEYVASWYPGESSALDEGGRHLPATDIRAESVSAEDGQISLPGRHTTLTVTFEAGDKIPKRLNSLELTGDDGSPVKLKLSNVDVAPK